MADNVYRDENSKKIIISGMYPGNIITDKFPLDFRFAFYTEIFFPDEREYELDLEFLFDKKKRGGAKATLGGSPPGLPSIFVIPQIDFRFETPGNLEARLTVEGITSPTIFRRRIALLGSE